MKLTIPLLNKISLRSAIIVFLTLISGCSFLYPKRNDSTTSLPVSHIAPDTPSPVVTPTTQLPTPSPVVTPTTPLPTTSAASPSGSPQCIQPSAQDYMYGNYSVGWSLHGDYYTSVLQMRGSSGKMLTEYFNPAIKAPDAVLQTMTLKACSFGLVIIGSNPLIPTTRKPHPNYAADGLVIRRQPNGQVLVFVCDTAKNCTPAQVKRQ